jgi:hypothetical protein
VKLEFVERPKPTYAVGSTCIVTKLDGLFSANKTITITGEKLCCLHGKYSRCSRCNHKLMLVYRYSGIDSRSYERGVCDFINEKIETI